MRNRYMDDGVAVDFRWGQYLYIVVMLFFVTGCATTRIPAEKVGMMKRVGVISVTAHEFHRCYTGLTIFGNERERQDISSWGIDNEYEAQIQKALSELGLFEAVIVPYDRKDFFSVYNINGPWDAPAFRKEWVNIEDQVKAFSHKHSLDAVVMVIWHDYDDVFATSPQRLRGAGLFARGAGGVTLVSVVHLLSSMGILDGHTGKPIVTEGLVFSKPVSPQISRTSLKDMDENVLRTMLVDLPKEGWEPRFRRIFLNESL